MHGVFVRMHKQCKACAAAKVPGECPCAMHNTAARKEEQERRKRRKRWTEEVGERKREAREDF